MAKALFEQIFEGPDSVFGRIFGPSKKPVIRVSLTDEHMMKLFNGDALKFQAESNEIEIKRAK